LVLAAIIAVGSVTLSSCGASPQPDVASITPTVGPSRGGTPVTIDGSDLSGVTAVRFGATSASFTIVNGSEVTTVAPPGHGAVDVTVRGAGTTTGGSHVDFAYMEPPSVTSISVSSGSARGGTRFVVHGAGFSATTVVLVGPRRARVLTVLRPTTLVAITPAGFGTEEVRAANADGVSATSARTVFRYRTTVLVIGDSLGIDLGWGFASARTAGGVLTVTDDAVGSTGLVRSDFYNWPLQLGRELRKLHPDVVVALFGANDEQAMTTSHGLAQLGTKPWATAYEQRIRSMASVAAEHRATLLWVGLPRMSPTSDLSASLVAVIDRLGRLAMAGRADATFVSTSSLFTSASGRYTPYVRLGRGVVLNGRQPDGVHLTPAGATAIDDLVVEALQLLG
jgi:lysophospholipase L1-like esterase